MDIKELKNILDKENAKIIIVEDGVPVMVVSKFEGAQESLPLDIPQEIPNNEVTQGTEFLTKEDVSNDELTVEDLPF
jgi:hypothetical protein